MHTTLLRGKTCCESVIFDFEKFFLPPSFSLSLSLSRVINEHNLRQIGSHFISILNYNTSSIKIRFLVWCYYYYYYYLSHLFVYKVIK